MTSRLIITSVEDLQREINETLKEFSNTIGVYVSLNKTQKSIEKILNKEKIKTNKIFFIDCVTSEKTRDDVLHIRPSELDKLLFSINEFIRGIEGEKYILIDALSTLLIYNTENKVANFIKELTTKNTSNHTKIIAFSPKTKGEELLEKVFNFFDEVKK